MFFNPLAENDPVDILDYDNMSAMPKITVAEKINVVELTVHNEGTSAEQVYTASDVGVDEMERAASVANPVVADGPGTAEWLLATLKHRLTYRVQERGNPARDLADTVIIHDAYGGTRSAVVMGQHFNYDGGLKCETELWGGDAS